MGEIILIPACFLLLLWFVFWLASPMPFFADKVIAELRRQGLLSPAGEQPSPYVVSDDGRREAASRTVKALVSAILLPAINTNVRVAQCNGLSRSPRADGDFHIFLYSSPEGSPILDTPKNAWGCSVPQNNKKAFAPTLLGLPVVDESGVVAAELLQHNLYIHYDLVKFGTYSETVLLAHLLLAVVRELANFDTLTVAGLEARVVDHFCNQCSNGVRNNTRAVNAGATNTRTANTQATNLTTVSEADLIAAREEFIGVFARAAGIQTEYFRLDWQSKNAFGREYDALLANQKVRDVRLERGKLKVDTETLYCVDPRSGRRHEIGQFEIIIPLGGGASSIRWMNKTRVVDTGYAQMCAPHVLDSGKACLGNLKEVLNQLLAGGEYAAAVEAAVAFVEAVNVEDGWGSTVHHWPLA